MKNINKLFALPVLALCLAACSTNVPLSGNKAEIEERSGSGSGANAKAGSIGGDALAVRAIDASTDPSGKGLAESIATRSIHFDLDSYVVRQEFYPALHAHAKYLTQDLQRKIQIEGHTDESGGREYNIALGQKRAEAVWKVLSMLGVQASQVETLSFGEEKPRATGSDEASNAQNRRADIAY